MYFYLLELGCSKTNFINFQVFFLVFDFRSIKSLTITKWMNRHNKLWIRRDSMIVTRQMPLHFKASIIIILVDNKDRTGKFSCFHTDEAAALADTPPVSSIARRLTIPWQHLPLTTKKIISAPFVMIRRKQFNCISPLYHYNDSSDYRAKER